MTDNYEPTICQQIGEPHQTVVYTDCLKCRFRICPIRKLFDLFGYKFPELMNELKGEEC